MTQNQIRQELWEQIAYDEFIRRAVAEVRLGMARTRAEMSAAKVKAGLRHAATEEFQDYPEGTIELGAALDAIDMILHDVLTTLQSGHA